MRILALLTSIFILPIIVLLATILYGGISTSVVKEEIAKAGVYEKIISFVHEPSDDNSPSDPTADAVFGVIERHLTPSYAQEKIEGVIDDSEAWIIGKSANPPVLSFKELKDEIVAKNPTLLSEIETMSAEMQKMQAEQDPEAAKLQNQKNELTNFIKNDFSFPLKDQIIGIKQTYATLTIALPVLLVLLLLCIAAMLFFSKTWRSRFMWVGTTFLLGGIWCYLMLLLSQSMSQATKEFILNLAQENHAQFASPALEKLFTVFINQQTMYQTQVSIALALLGVLLIGGSFILRGKPAPPPLPAKKPVKKK